MAEDNGFAMGYALGQDSNGGGGNNGGFGGSFGEGLWAVIILAILFGRGGFGWGGEGGGSGSGSNGGTTVMAIPGGYGFGGGCGCGSPCATQADVRNAVDQQTLISKLDQQTYGIADSTYALNNAITTGFAGVQQTLCQGFNGVNTSMLQGFNGVEKGFYNISSQISDCCCKTNNNIERGFADTNYNIATQFCNLQNTLNSNTRDIVDNQNAGTRAILDFLTQDKISSLQTENQTLRFQASQAQQNAFITANQEAQTAELIRRLGADCPVPAYVVPNPNCCYGNPIGVGYNYGGQRDGGCGCC